MQVFRVSIWKCQQQYTVQQYSWTLKYFKYFFCCLSLTVSSISCGQIAPLKYCSVTLWHLAYNPALDYAMALFLQWCHGLNVFGLFLNDDSAESRTTPDGEPYWIWLSLYNKFDLFFIVRASGFPLQTLSLTPFSSSISSGTLPRTWFLYLSLQITSFLKIRVTFFPASFMR